MVSPFRCCCLWILIPINFSNDVVLLLLLDVDVDVDRILFQSDETKVAESSKAFPLADAHLTASILDVISHANNYKQLKKGANEGDPPLPLLVVEIILLIAEILPHHSNEDAESRNQ